MFKDIPPSYLLEILIQLSYVLLQLWNAAQAQERGYTVYGPYSKFLMPIVISFCLHNFKRMYTNRQNLIQGFQPSLTNTYGELFMCIEARFHVIDLLDASLTFDDLCKHIDPRSSARPYVENDTTNFSRNLEINDACFLHSSIEESCNTGSVVLPNAGSTDCPGGTEPSVFELVPNKTVSIYQL
ncbi:hypothetical protein DE146DRAFT_151221 [Phaeosphaeria sp. MPI-PUGE-AT-0046c]|nr:hypothetical protein DE146DRAFT_151221 [Phaeosphaeria sp. MPI-PUGE-AT-0046c]